VGSPKKPILNRVKRLLSIISLFHPQLGDLLELYEDNGDWWLARSRNTGRKGYIPCNYVASVKSLEAEPYVHFYMCILF